MNADPNPEKAVFLEAVEQHAPDEWPAFLDQPHIARVIDVGNTDSGRPYFVMELVKGIPITRYCDEHHLTPRQRLERFLPVCHAIQHAHQKSIIHRDLKPSNVLVADYDDRPVPKVIDFGVAKAAGLELTERSQFTEFGQIVGTLEYMSPEQAKLNALDIDTRSDIYALGVMLYELLTGATPFDRKRLSRAAFDEVLRIIREEEPPRPSTRVSTLGRTATAVSAQQQGDLRKLSQLFRGELDWIVMKCLERDRSRRYETANELGRDIERYLRDETVQAAPPSAWYRFRKFARRNKEAMQGVSAVLAMLVAALGMLAADYVQIREGKRRTQQALDDLRVQSGRTEEALRAGKLARDRLDRTLYFHRVALAHREWLANNVARVDQLLDECPPPMRHWEWHYLHRLCHGDLLTLAGHRSAVKAVRYSSDGSRIASVDRAGIVKR